MALFRATKVWYGTKCKRHEMHVRKCQAPCRRFVFRAYTVCPALHRSVRVCLCLSVLAKVGLHCQALGAVVFTCLQRPDLRGLTGENAGARL